MTPEQIAAVETEARAWLGRQYGPCDENLAAAAWCIRRLLDALVALREDLAVAHQIGDTFWEALKPLKLTTINVHNPGQHVTDVIRRAEAAEAEITRLREAANALVEKWRAGGAAKDTVHATMGVGWKACADDLAAAFSTPEQP